MAGSAKYLYDSASDCPIALKMVQYDSILTVFICDNHNEEVSVEVSSFGIQ